MVGRLRLVRPLGAAVSASKFRRASVPGNIGRGHPVPLPASLRYYYSCDVAAVGPRVRVILCGASSVTTAETMLRGFLSREAIALGAGRRLPFDLSGLLGELGLGLTSESDTNPRAAHGSLRRIGEAWGVVVNRTTSPARQRFTIAHEIGHYLIEARVGFRPGTTREYWMLEDACQAFAADLLSPASFVDACVSPRPSHPDALFEPLESLMAATELSLEACSRRIVETIDGATAIAAIDLPGSDPRDGACGSGTLGWLHANRTWIRHGRGQRIGTAHALGAAMTTIQGLAVGERASRTLDQGHLASLERRGPSFGLAVIFLAA